MEKYIKNLKLNFEGLLDRFLKSDNKKNNYHKI